MKILIAPLNWGLGHATRCIPIIEHYLQQGHQVILAGDGDSLLLLQQRFPSLTSIDFPPLKLHYTSNPHQLGFYIRAIFSLIRATLADHYHLQQLLAREHFDLIISDNRFGLYTRDTQSIYITHQLYPILPKRLKIFQPLARAIHACIYKRYHHVWVPDYADPLSNLSGQLSHGGHFDQKAKYIGPVSRFQGSKSSKGSKGSMVLAILSGLEPQRSIFEKELLERFAHSEENLLLVRGKVSAPKTTIQRANITIIPSISDAELVSASQQANKIIARSGYSTIMDLEALGVLHKAELHPTPGQSEQEYLAEWLA